MLTLHPIEALRDNYIWTIVNDTTQECVVIDPGEAGGVLAFIDEHNLSLKAILITHHHWDHTSGIADILTRYPVPVYAGANEPVTPKDVPLDDNAQLEIESMALSLQSLSIPGHTLGHIALFGHGWLFSGDTLFTAGCGRVFEGTAEQMHTSLMRLAALPQNTQVYCGHEYTLANLSFAKIVEPDNPHIKTRLLKAQKQRQQSLPTVPATLAEEHLTNPFLRCHTPTVIQSAEAYAGHPLAHPTEVFSIIRKWKNSL